jgi:hypothetical protein
LDNTFLNDTADCSGPKTRQEHFLAVKVGLNF